MNVLSQGVFLEQDTRIGIIGCSGRMGRLIQNLLLEHSGYAIGPGFSRTGEHFLCDVIESNDLLVDFSSSAITSRVLRTLLENPKPLILGTTLPKTSAEIARYIEELSCCVPVVVCPNMSLGAYIQKRLAAVLAEILDDRYDIRVTDMHHRWKKDTVSGTAQDLLDTVCRTKYEVWQQEYQVGKGAEHHIELHVSRVGNIPGDHEVSFISEKEQISVRHTVFSRDIFAEGVLKMINWLVHTSPKAGCYGVEAIWGPHLAREQCLLKK